MSPLQNYAETFIKNEPYFILTGIVLTVPNFEKWNGELQTGLESRSPLMARAGASIAQLRPARSLLYHGSVRPVPVQVLLRPGRPGPWI